jgi:hypothetical protein
VFGKLLCTYKRCWKWCPRASIQAWTRLILFANTFCRSACEMFLMYIVIAVFNSWRVCGLSRYTAAKCTAIFWTPCISLILFVAVRLQHVSRATFLLVNPKRAYLDLLTSYSYIRVSYFFPNGLILSPSKDVWTLLKNYFALSSNKCIWIMFKAYLKENPYKV